MLTRLTTLPFALMLFLLGALTLACEPAAELSTAVSEPPAGSPGEDPGEDPGEAQDAAPAPTEQDEFLARATAEVIKALKDGAGIIMPGPVEVALLTTAEATARRRAYAESLGDDVGFTAAMDSMADLMFAGNLLGRYLPDEEVVYIIEDVLFARAAGSDERAMETLFPVLAHEMVHAYDHMVYGAVPAPDDLEELLADPSALPEIQALMSLLEGRATYASELACHAAGYRPLYARSVEQALDSEFIESDGSMGGEAVAGIGNGIIRMKLVQYAYGRVFAKRVHDFGGELFFAQVFASLPISMGEVEDFSLFLIRWAEAQEAALDELDEDVESHESASAAEGER